jgi:excisionase family DNA binding protein
LEELADYLRLSNDTVCRMANTGTISDSKVGNQWRFRGDDVDHWLETNKNFRRDEAPDGE